MRTHSTTLILALIVAPSSLCATLPVAWVSESEEYVQLLRAKLTTDWDVRWCGANGTACTAGTDPSSGAVRAIVGRPVAGDLSALPKLALVQGASWFQEYAPAAVPLRASIAPSNFFVFFLWYDFSKGSEIGRRKGCFYGG